MAAAKIEPAQSVMLDVVRFGAALAVFVGHASGVWLTGGYLWQVGRGTNAAVTIFFVLSGYVVAATLKPSTGAADYLAQRLSRLWSVVIPALAVTLLCDTLGQALAPDFYQVLAPTKTEMVIGLNHNEPVRYLLSGLMAQEWHVFGLSPRQPGTNMPFWSLSYEFTYYLAFAALLFLRGLPRLLALALLFALAGAAILLMWPLWLAGAWLWRVRHRIAPRAGWLLAVLGGLGLAGIYLLHGPIERLDVAWGSALNRFPATNLWAGASIAAFIAGFDVVSRPLDRVAARVGGAIRVVADHTFELYLMHIPLVFLAAAVAPRPGRALFVYAVAILGVVVVARWTAPLRDRLRRGIRSALASRAAAR